MMGTQKIIQQFYNRREARLRTRMNESTDLIGKYRLLRAIYQNRKNTIDKFGKSVTIKSQDISSDGGPGSGNHGHKGVPGQVGGSAPSGAAEEATKFKTARGKMKITSDLKIKASKSGKTTVTIKEGGEIEGIYSFAGKGANKSLVVAGALSKQYGGKPAEWGHLCGFATVVTDDGIEQRREIHWFEHKDVGQIKFKVKKRGNPT